MATRTIVVGTADAVPESTVNAKGDLLAATANDTLTRLGVGTNDYVLTADSAEATGIKWAAASGGVSGPPLYKLSNFQFLPGLTRTTFADPIIATTTGTTYYFGPYYPNEAYTIDALIFSIQAVTNANVRIALIALDADLKVSALTEALTETNYTTTGQKTLSFSSPLTVTAGTPYFVGFRANASVSLKGTACQYTGGYLGYENGYRTYTHVELTETYGAFGSPPTDWTLTTDWKNTSSTADTIGLSIPFSWRLN